MKSFSDRFLNVILIAIFKIQICKHPTRFAWVCEHMRQPGLSRVLITYAMISSFQWSRTLEMSSPEVGGVDL